MFRRLLSRVVSVLTPIGLSVALTAAGCETSPNAAEAAVDVRAAADEPSAWALAHGDAIADAIVADPAFTELAGVTAELMGDLHEAMQPLPDEEVDAIAVTVTEPAFADVWAPDVLLGHLGGNPQDLQVITQLFGQLQTNHGLQGASAADFEYIFGLAVDSDAGQAKMAAALAPVFDPDAPIPDPCETLCYHLHTLRMLFVMAKFLVSIAAIVLTFPWGLIFLALVIGELERDLAEAAAQLAACLAECNGEPLPGIPCGEDVCGPDQFCWTGVLGIGANECRDKKELGKTCSRHEKCLSGCCKLHIWTHPTSKVCRPANKCN